MGCSLGPRQQCVVIAAVTVTLLILTLVLTFSDSIQRTDWSDQLNQAVANLEIAGLENHFSIFTQDTKPDQPSRWDTDRAGDVKAGSKYTDNPAALYYSWLQQLPEKVPIDVANLQDGSITWTQEAEDIIIAVIERVQFPPSCSKAKWLAVPMHMGG